MAPYGCNDTAVLSFRLWQRAHIGVYWEDYDRMVTALRGVWFDSFQQQGAFAEHSSFLSKLGADVREVRLPHEFDGLDGIVLPGTCSPCGWSRLSRSCAFG